MAKTKKRRYASKDRWNGQTVYRCEHVLPSGRVCGHDTLDVDQADAHDRSHDPRPTPQPSQTTPTDRFGNPIPEES